MVAGSDFGLTMSMPMERSSYYVQKLYSVHTGQEELEIKPALGEGLYAAVSYDREQGEVDCKADKMPERKLKR